MRKWWSDRETIESESQRTRRGGSDGERARGEQGENRRYKKINTEREKVIKRERAGASEGGGEEDGGGWGAAAAQLLLQQWERVVAEGRELLPRGLLSCLPPRQQPTGPRLRGGWGGCRFGAGAYEQGSAAHEDEVGTRAEVKSDVKEKTKESRGRKREV